jgi:predicted Rossmann fold nucleotide-binding protein DprA/Smf involved in DNA uptake
VSDQAQVVLVRLRDAGASANELGREVGLDPAAVAAALMELELAGLVAEEGGTYRAC